MTDGKNIVSKTLIAVVLTVQMQHSVVCLKRKSR